MNMIIMTCMTTQKSVVHDLAKTDGIKAANISGTAAAFVRRQQKAADIDHDTKLFSDQQNKINLVHSIFSTTTFTK